VAGDEAERRRVKAERLKGTFERRTTPATALECRTLSDGTLHLGGYGATTADPYSMGTHDEVILPGAFKRTLANSPPPTVNLLVNHEGLPLASTPTGTLTLAEDQRGLRWEADLDPEDDESQRLVRKIARGLVTDCSFGFRVDLDEWSKDMSLRTIKVISMSRGDVSVCTTGANPHASVALRSRETAATSLSVLTASHREREQLALMGIDVPRRGSRGTRAPDYARVEREQIARLRKGA